MRVLVVHNRYRSEMPSGENIVVDDDIRNLRNAGVEVATFFRDSDTISSFGAFKNAALAVSPVYSLEAVPLFRKVLRTFRPDVVHLHNPYPLVSPWVVRVAVGADIPVVQTVHNFRHSCPASTSLFRDGRPCEDCVGRPFPWPGIVHRCYRGSRSQSCVMAIATRAHRSTWQLVSRFLAVSDFVGDHLVAAGIPAGKIVVHPNTAQSHGHAHPPGRDFVFLGRLTAEKGIRLLISAWAQSDLSSHHRLVVAGDGPSARSSFALKD